MPDPNNVSPGAIGTRIDMSTAPGGDLDWDTLFPNPELAAQQPQAVQGTTPQTPPQATGPFLKAGETVYNTAEDAITGTVHKDQEIARLRGYLKERGINPNTLQEAQAPQVRQPDQQPTQRFFDKVADAATRRDKDAYESAMREFIGTIVDPWRPTLAQMNAHKAYQQVAREVPGFKEFYENGKFAETLEKNPLLKEMNQIGENDPTAAQRLPELYRLAYFNYQGTQPVQATTPVTPPTVRPQQSTLQPSALTPPAPTPSTQGWSQPSHSLTQRGTNEARKALIQDGDRRFEGFRFEDVGL